MQIMAPHITGKTIFSNLYFWGLAILDSVQKFKFLQKSKLLKQKKYSKIIVSNQIIQNALQFI